MVLFRPSSITHKVFKKKTVIEDIIQSVGKKFPDTHILKPTSISDSETPDLYDLLVIRNRFFEVKKVIGQYDGLNSMRLQQVFAIKVCDEKEREKMSRDEEVKVRDWVTKYIITDNVADVIRMMESTD